jgi:NADH:ubiquinone oxidoreductase subunit 6 (subunit J)
MDLVTLIVAAAEGAEGAHHEEQSATLFLVVGAILAIFAVVVSVLGIRNAELPESATRLITMVGIVLVVATSASMIVIST